MEFNSAWYRQSGTRYCVKNKINKIKIIQTGFHQTPADGRHQSTNRFRNARFSWRSSVVFIWPALKAGSLPTVHSLSLSLSGWTIAKRMEWKRKSVCVFSDVGVASMTARFAQHRPIQKKNAPPGCFSVLLIGGRSLTNEEATFSRDVVSIRQST